MTAAGTGPTGGTGETITTSLDAELGPPGALGRLMDLSGRVAVVTGGAGHIGRRFCDTLAELGAHVVVVDLDPAACAALAGSLAHRHGGDHSALPLDLADEEQARALAPFVADRYGRLHVLVNGAAFVGTSGLEGWACEPASQCVRTWREALELNLTVPFLLTQTCTDLLACSGRGSVINVASIYGLVGADLSLYEGTTMGSPGAYAASKGGLVQLTRWAATVLAPRVRVNALSPGGIAREQPAPFVSRYIHRTPLRRMGHEDDLRGALAYLASDLSAYVTGHNLLVDGGWTAW